mmetsp:Transcript_20159/g.56144  ORF Transcript_20159/g.56144 Transcript_20159/m.56144 type:complete len:687 (-) Transcript_20159:861-2921(-)|eukprot:CAMPEP_0202348528 /NCGR_PEP_ID=MMETSP1126-20121109/6414_1 /ASSEMBLY_ACC=CAM_ASM_000457 /TAXON_ID=3047 /ORGANISM="Dunaliella tertiolecta, Strain CCMP1320" /LENGTH=686 /DNA_ID=CAMNT_0048940217 /DNA_START=230 /DNA_END=2290 /DNA_ORIENTATION=+
MGAGGDGNRPHAADTMRDKDITRRKRSFTELKELGKARGQGLQAQLKSDLLVLKHIWFSKAQGDDHASRLENFYGPQAKAYDKFRANFLWGRKPMLAACAARLAQRRDLIWVDLGGGTGENVDMMFEYLPMECFKAIYVVDLCHSLCEVAKQKVLERGWKNVHVVESDACTFTPPGGSASLVTFSYSLSMIPPFHNAVDAACSYLSNDGFLGVADFFVSGKYDLPMRQMPWLRRFFWRATFDTDNIDIGPERRVYLEHRLERVWEINSQGSIPYVPYLRAPYYVWIGRRHQLGHVPHENKVDRPALFPPTFLYTQSWEDPAPDMEVMDINPKDRVLTLTSGGCNALNLLLHGAGEVVSVDCNPAQSALLELKVCAIQHLEYDDVWQMFGEGRHPRIESIYERTLAPFLSQTSNKFWCKRLWYFKKGLYFQGGMGNLCWVVQCLLAFLGFSNTVKRIANAPTLEEQRHIYDSTLLLRFIKHGPALLVWIFRRIVTLLCFNRIVLWFGGGVPAKQYDLIKEDGLPVDTYIARVFDGVAENSHLRSSNYFYYNCMTGHFLKDNCPAYLKEPAFRQLKAGLIDRLTVETSTFLDELRSRKYTKVILMDHLDWLSPSQHEEYAQVLAQQVPAGGIVIWRSAALCPSYSAVIARAGFDVRCVSRADQGYMDRVNMYSSFFVATRLGGSSKMD